MARSRRHHLQPAAVAKAIDPAMTGRQMHNGLHQLRTRGSSVTDEECSAPILVAR